jgi:hypothetical protein
MDTLALLILAPTFEGDLVFAVLFLLAVVVAIMASGFRR